MFRLTANEQAALRFQSGTLRPAGAQHRKYLPYRLHRAGSSHALSVLHSDRAVQVNIAIMRAFVRLRQIMSTHKDLAAKLEKLERKLGEHDEHFHVVFEAIRQLMGAAAPVGKKGRIGFHAG